MPNQRSKKKKHFTAAAEIKLLNAIEKYAKINNLDRNTALRKISWESSVREGVISEIPEDFLEEVKLTQKKILEKKKLSRAKKK